MCWVYMHGIHASYLGPKYVGVEVKISIPGIGFEIIVFGQILPHKIRLSDMRSPNSKIQLRYTPNTMPIRDCQIVEGITYDLG